ncbi:MAG: carboxypeptidase-like regulatory domain-containing protein [Gemmatimonadaceae bacterium]
MPRNRRHIAATVALLHVAAAPLAAQQLANGRLEGIVREKVASRSVSAASVSLVRLESETSITFSARPDVRGRYHLDSLPAGRYLVQLSSPTLDSLDLALPGSELRISGGKTSHVDMPLPFGAQLRDAICHGLTLATGKAAIAGRAIDADTDQPIAGADVVAAWTEISVDRTTLKSKTQRRTAVVATGSRGEYRMCGVPSATPLTMQLQHAGRAGALLRLSISEDEGAVVRDVSLSPRSAPTIAALDSVERTLDTTSADSTRQELQLTGTATLIGRISGAGGLPLPNVQVRVRDARSTAVTDSSGRFVLANLPSGTQLVVVRHLGYALTELPVELRTDRSVAHDVKLTRAAILDSVRVVAARSTYAEFEHNRRINTLGKFIAQGEIMRRDPKETADLMATLGGFKIVGRGAQAKVFVQGASVAQPLCREANIVINGLDGMSINDVAPRDIAGIEAYRDAVSAPSNVVHKSDCGLIVIWLRNVANQRPASPGPAPLRGNGYP